MSCSDEKEWYDRNSSIRVMDRARKCFVPEVEESLVDGQRKKIIHQPLFLPVDNHYAL